jgi:hypothetical protein
MSSWLRLNSCARGMARFMSTQVLVTWENPVFLQTLRQIYILVQHPSTKQKALYKFPWPLPPGPEVMCAKPWHVPNYQSFITRCHNRKHILVHAKFSWPVYPSITEAIEWHPAKTWRFSPPTGIQQCNTNFTSPPWTEVGMNIEYNPHVHLQFQRALWVTG